MPILAPSPRALAEAGARLREGGLVAFPTETVYGLGANALDPAAVARIFLAKGRPSNNPLIVHAPSTAAARALTREWPPEAQALADAFWPGPLTLVLPRARAVPDGVTAGLDTVGVRVPAHPVALALLGEAGVPLAAPSANRYTMVSPTTAEHVRAAFGDAVPILDGGPAEVGVESTVLSLVGPPRVLRPGRIGLEDLRPFLPDVARLDLTVEDEAAPSPGLSRRHYAPRARVVLGIRAPTTAGTGVLHLGAAPAGHGHALAMPADPAGYGRSLYAALHACDALGCEVIAIEPPPDNEAWSAIWDRLRRAGAGFAERG